MNARWMMAAGVVCAVGLWAGDVGAQEGRRMDAPWRMSLEIGGRWHHDRGLDAFATTRSPPVAGIMVARDVVALGDRATLSVDANWTAAGFEARLRNAMRARLTAHGLTAGLTVRVRTWWWMEPYARVAAGAMYSDMSLTPESGTAQGGGLTGGEWNFVGTGGVGVQWTTPPFLGPIRFAGALEGGYQLALAQEMRVRPVALSNDAAQADRIAVGDTSLGTLDQSGGYLRALFGLRF